MLPIHAVNLTGALMLTTRELANAIRFLSMDAIQKANSGHPGMPLGMADIATVLWREFLQHNPANPHWINRDRFILSNGHGSMLQYSLLHLTGYALTIEDLKNFRQLHSKTPGHPEIGCAPGIETTTGPLGQGLANAVGMALAEKTLAAQFNRSGLDIIDHYTYVFLGDGCLMEGISHEVCSFAGTHKLGKLIAFWDNNGISIDGHVENWFTDNTPQRFAAYGWHVVSIDGHDENAIRQAVLEAKAINDRPSIICCKTILGFGAPNMCNTHDCHGNPLGIEEINQTRTNLNWQYAPFEIPEDIYSAFDARVAGEKHEAVWSGLFSVYQEKYPDLAEDLLRRMQRELPKNWSEKVVNRIEEFGTVGKDLATRQASQQCLEFLGPILPELLGGSADLTPSNLTNWSGSKDITSNSTDGNYLHYGIREFGMFAMMTGIALHGGFIPYGGTFLVFASYAHSAMRMAAMMRQRVIYVLTHDSVGLGEDGPTHQPVEQLTMLRATPNLSVWRPADMVETAVAWQMAIERMTGPTCLALSRQKTLNITRSSEVTQNIKRGGYILLNCAGYPEAIVVATGAEVGIAYKAVEALQKAGRYVRLVSMPSTNVFAAQSLEYREAVLPTRITKKLVVEAGVSDGWYKYIGSEGKVLGIDRYGESAPAAQLFEFFGFTEENIVKAVLEMMQVGSRV